MSAVLYPDAIPVVERVAADCIRDGGEGLMAFSDSLGLRDGFLTVKLAAVEPWGGIMKENSPGAAPQSGRRSSSPRGPWTRWCGPDHRRVCRHGLCAQGTAVSYLAVPDEAHFRVAFHTAKEAVAWMADRFAGKPAPDECVKGK